MVGFAANNIMFVVQAILGKNGQLNESNKVSKIGTSNSWFFDLSNIEETGIGYHIEK